MKRFRQDIAGNATLEFVVLLPFLTFFFLALGEIGTFMARNVQLERSLDIAMRDVRLGKTSVATHEGLKDRICEEAFLISECRDNLLLELSTFGSLGGFGAAAPTGGVRCINRASDIDPVISFDVSGPGEIVLVRACLIADPVFPSTGFMALLPDRLGGGYAVLAQAAFINEPG